MGTYGPELFRFEDSGGTERLNMLDPTGWMLSRGFNLGSSELEQEWLGQAPFDGATLVSSYRPNVEMSIPLHLMPQTTTPDMKTKFDLLVVELSRDTNIIEFRPKGFSNSYLIDTFKASIPTLLRGLDMPSPFSLKSTGVPVFLTIVRAPQLRYLGTNVYI